MPQRRLESRRAPCAFCPLELLEARALLAASPGSAFYSLVGYDANAVSADGTTVVGSGPYRWTVAGGRDDLGQPPGKVGGTALGVNADGSVVVGSARDATARGEAFEWTEDFEYEFLGYVGGNSFLQSSSATGVSADGDVVVGTSTTPPASPFSGPGEPRAFRWTPGGGIESLGTLPGDYASRGTGVSADGSVIVGRSDGNVRSEAFRWTSATGMRGLGDLPGGIVASEAFAVSADGSTIVGQGFMGEGNAPAFRWTQAGGMVSVGDLPGGAVWAQALAVNGDGSVIVGTAGDDLDEFNRAGTDRAAFIWDAAHGMRRLQDVLEDEYGLDLTGWDLGNATGISANGKVIVGNNVGGIHGYTGWVAVLGVPLGQPAARVSGRHLFYNDSVFDGRNPAANAADVNAIAPDKQALLPGGVASFNNVSSYSRGITGVMLDVHNLPADRTLGADDFDFRVGNNANTGNWAAAPAPSGVTVLRSAVPEAPARVLVTWADRAIVNKWLRVQVLANSDTGLAQPDVSYFGSLVGETGDTSTPRVNLIDFIRTRAATTSNASIENRFDFNRDGRVNVIDAVITRNNQLARLYHLQPTSAAPAGAAATELLREAPNRRGEFATQ